MFQQTKTPSKAFKHCNENCFSLLSDLKISSKAWDFVFNRNKKIFRCKLNGKINNDNILYCFFSGTGFECDWIFTTLYLLYLLCSLYFWNVFLTNKQRSFNMVWHNRNRGKTLLYLLLFRIHCPFSTFFPLFMQKNSRVFKLSACKANIKKTHKICKLSAKGTWK